MTLSASPPASAAPSQPAAALPILLLDDDCFMLDVLADMLGGLGHQAIRTETDARRALTLLASDAPALLICDLSMPDMDGIEFMQAAAAAGFTGHVMLLSGMDSGVRKAAERLAHAHGLNVLGAFQKPISAAEMAAALIPLTGIESGRPAPAHANLHNLTPLPTK